MAKRKLGKRKRDTDSSMMERITEDGILCLIISSLPLREAVRTCVLSRRWKHIWTYISHLNFDSQNMLNDADNIRLDKGKNIPILRDKFITYVDAVLQQHQGFGIDKFNITFFLNEIPSHRLDAWVRFAVASKTKEIIFSPPCLCDGEPNSDDFPYSYDFPCHLLGSSLLESLSLFLGSLKPPHGFDGLPHLKKLHLYKVDVTGKDVGLLLSNCFTLEYLELCLCPRLETLNILQPLPQLTHIIVRACFQLRKIEMNAVNLTDLSHYNSTVNFVFGDSSQVRNGNFHFGEEHVDCSLTKITNNFPRLEKLCFFSTKCASKVPTQLVRSFNRLIHLKDLVWGVRHTIGNKVDLLSLASILIAAPFLEKFAFHCIGEYKGYPRELKELELITPIVHTHLKTAHFFHVTGDKWQIRLAVYILKCAIQLDSMILVRHIKFKDKKFSEKNVEHLKQEVPANVKLVIY